jgi:hypothetical protein
MEPLHATARVIDLLATSFAFGATAWFFFVQSPVLLKRLGREKFVPIQMGLTVVLFRTLTAATALVVLATALQGHPPQSSPMLTALVALAGSLINQLVVVPRALRAGGASRQDLKGKDRDASTAAFASEGAGNRTRLLHRLVVLFVVVMLAGLVLHAV